MDLKKIQNKGRIKRYFQRRMGHRPPSVFFGWKCLLFYLADKWLFVSAERKEEMGLNQTPAADRVHIGFFGRRNAGMYHHGQKT